MTVLNKVGGWHEKERTMHRGEPEDNEIGGTLACMHFVLYQSRGKMVERTWMSSGTGRATL